jgi:EmrB/QacA subfamily drug resistance transporter
MEKSLFPSYRVLVVMRETKPSSKLSPRDLMIVIVIALGSFMAGLDGTIVNIALPSIAKSFAVSTVLVSWVLNAYLIVMVSLLLAASRIGDIRGYRNLFLTGFGIFTLGSALCGMAPTIDILILSRMLQAVGGAVISALGAVMITSYLSSEVRGQALGIVAMFLMLGAALGPVVGGYLTTAFSWQYIFYVNLPVGIAAVLLGMRVLPERDPVSPNATLDIPGVALLFAALGLLVIGLTSIQGNKAMAGAVSLVLSGVFWVVFILQERHAREPLINLALFSNRAYSLQNISILLIQMAMAGVMVVMPFYLELVKQIPADNAGTVLLALPVGMILTAPIAGKMSDVIGTRKPIIAGFAISAFSLYLLSTISATTSIGDTGIYLFLLGAGTGIAYSPLNSAVMGEAPAKDRGSTSGLMRVMTNLGSTLGVSVVMLVATVAAGPRIAEVTANRILPTALTGAFDSAFFFCMGLEVLGILLMLAVAEKKPPEKIDGEVALGF